MAEEVYSSAHLRERDKIIEEKYKKQVEEVERKLARTKETYKGIYQTMFDLENRLQRLAKGLGFENAHEAQLEVDTADVEGGFKGCLEKVRALKKELDDERDEKEMLLIEAEGEKTKLREKLERVTRERDARITESSQIRKEHEELRTKYDLLEDKRVRAAERYKSDYKKWKLFHDWLVDNDDPEGPSIAMVKQFNFEERKKYLTEIAKKKKAAVQAGAPYPVPERFEWEDVPDTVEKEKVESSVTPPDIQVKVEPFADASALDKANPSVPEQAQEKEPLSSSTVQKPPNKTNHSVPQQPQRKEPSSSSTLQKPPTAPPSSTVQKPSLPPLSSTVQKPPIAPLPSTVQKPPTRPPSPLLIPKQEISDSPTIFNTSLPVLNALATKAKIPATSTSNTRSSSVVSNSTTVVNTPITTPLTSANSKAGRTSKPAAPPASATPKPASTRTPLTFVAEHTTRKIPKVKQEPQSAVKVPVEPKRAVTPPSPERNLDFGVPNSSDTEDDSQAPILPPNFFPKSNSAKPKKGFVRASSETDEDSQAPNLPMSPVEVKPFAFSSQSSLRPKLKRRNSDSVLAPRSSQEDDPILSDAGPSRPNKVRKVTGVEFTSRPRTVGKENRAPDENTPQNRAARGGNKGVMSTGRGKQWAVEKGKGKGKGVARDADFDTPVGAKSAVQRTLDDYSYKGIGRSAKNAGKSAGDRTINSMFMIDPERNGGVGHAYEEVVRNKEQRKKMQATDCECCRDYYEAIGPLPPRMQGPLWATPSPKRCRKRSGDHRESSPLSPTRRHKAEIASHKATISRHRHTWARPTTPPGYWNIGFPDTQEAADINARAEEMHRQKMQMVAIEADSGQGRWKRR